MHPTDTAVNAPAPAQAGHPCARVPGPLRSDRPAHVIAGDAEGQSRAAASAAVHAQDGSGQAARSPLAEGRTYWYPGYPGAGFRVHTIRMPGHPHYDGGLPGVCVEFIGHRPLGRRVPRAWFPVGSESAFWAKPIFSNAADVGDSESTT